MQTDGQTSRQFAADIAGRDFLSVSSLQLSCATTNFSFPSKTHHKCVYVCDLTFCLSGQRLLDIAAECSQLVDSLFLN